MAELALGAFGAVVAGVQTMKGLQNLVEMVQDLRHASRDIEGFYLNVKTFREVLEHFCNTADQSFLYLEKDEKIKRNTLTDNLIEFFEMVRSDADLIVNHVRVSVSQEWPNLWKFRIRLQWFFRRASIEVVQLRMERVKSTASLYMSTIVCEGLNRFIKNMEATGGSVPELVREKYAYYQEKIREDRKQSRKAAHDCEVFRKSHADIPEISSAFEPSMKDFEAAVKQESHEVAPPRRVRRSKESRRSRNKTDNTGQRNQAANHVSEQFVTVPLRAESRPQSIGDSGASRDSRPQVPLYEPSASSRHHSSQRSSRHSLRPSQRLSLQPSHEMSPESSESMVSPPPARDSKLSRKVSHHGSRHSYRQPYVESRTPSPGLKSQSEASHGSSRRIKPIWDRHDRSLSPALPRESPRSSSPVSWHNEAEPQILPSDSRSVAASTTTTVFIGDRVRDDGKGVRVEKGQWPQRVLESGVPLGEGEPSPSRRDSKNMPSPRVSNPEDAKNELPRGTSSDEQVIAEYGPPNVVTEGGKDKWQPAPPFDEHDLKNFEKRRSSTR